MKMRMDKTLKVLYPDVFSRKKSKTRKKGFFSGKIYSFRMFLKEIETSKWVVYGSASLIALIIGYGVYAYNHFAMYTQAISTASADIGKEVQRRTDLINNLIPPTLEYVKHEKELFSHVVEIRKEFMQQTDALPGKDMEKIIPAELQAKLPSLMGIFENYPDLKASQPFADLMKELIETENRIAATRTDYNARVNEFNTYLVKVPAKYVAQILNFETMPYFEVTLKASSVPDMANKLTNSKLPHRTNGK